MVFLDQSFLQNKAIICSKISFRDYKLILKHKITESKRKLVFDKSFSLGEKGNVLKRKFTLSEDRASHWFWSHSRDRFPRTFRAIPETHPFHGYGVRIFRLQSRKLAPLQISQHRQGRVSIHNYSNSRRNSLSTFRVARIYRVSEQNQFTL